MIQVASLGLRRLALPAVAAALLSFTTLPSPAETSTSRVAGRAIERITPEATVVSTAHYQSSQSLICSGQHCRAEFPAVGNRRRLKLTRMSCSMRSAQYAAYATGKIDVRDAGNVSSVAQFLPADYSTDWGYHVINSGADVQVLAGRQIVVNLSLAPGSGIALDAMCTAHGTLETLQ